MVSAYDSRRNEAYRRTEVLEEGRRNEASRPIPRTEQGSSLKRCTSKGPSTTEKVLLAELEPKMILDVPNPKKRNLQAGGDAKKCFLFRLRVEIFHGFNLFTLLRFLIFHRKSVSRHAK